MMHIDLRLFVLAAVSVLVCLTVTAQAKQPNVLLIVVDDVGYGDISAYDHSAPDIDTPNINRIAADGVRFTNGYASSPICNVSRAAILTGRYPQQLKKFYYAGPGLNNQPTLAEQLQAAGYHTAQIGKTHLGSGSSQAKLSDSEIRTNRDYPINHGFDAYLGVPRSEIDYDRISQDDYDTFVENAVKKGVKRSTAEARARTAAIGPMVRGDKDAKGNPTIVRESHDGYTTDVFTTETITQMREAASAGRPFFIHLSYNSMHTQMDWATPQSYRLAQGVKDSDIKVQPYDGTIEMFGRTGYNGINAWGTKEFVGDIDDPRDTPGNKLRRKLYLAGMSHLDDNIGRLMDELEDKKMIDNTIVIFVSDNGGEHNISADNAPLTGHKYVLKEGGIRIPYLISWRGKSQAGAVSHATASHTDLSQTILAAAGIAKTEPTDGRDLTPILTGQADQDYRTQFWDSGFAWAVRHGNWKLLVRKRDRNWQNFSYPGGTFLHNLDSDIGERTNLADQYPELVAKMRALHTAWVQKKYEYGSAHRDNTLIVNGSFENTTALKQTANHWKFTGNVSASDQPGDYMGVDMSNIHASDGIWRAYMHNSNNQIRQTTSHTIGKGDVFELRFSVTGSNRVAGMTANLYYLNETDHAVDIANWKLTQLADNGDHATWQAAAKTFEAQPDADYIGRPIGVRFETTGPEGFRALDDVALTVTSK